MIAHRIPFRIEGFCFGDVGINVRRGKDVSRCHGAEMQRHVDEDEEEDFLPEDGKIHGTTAKAVRRRRFRHLRVGGEEEEED